MSRLVTILAAGCVDIHQFEVDDLEGFARQLEEKGVKLSDGPTKSSDIIFAFIDAPEGYEIELIQRLR